MPTPQPPDQQDVEDVRAAEFRELEEEFARLEQQRCDSHGSLSELCPDLTELLLGVCIVLIAYVIMWLAFGIGF